MAVYPLASGSSHPDVASNSAARFIPEIWAGKMIQKLYLETVFADIANSDYEGEVKNQGDNVIIRTTPTITIRDHAIDQELTYETPSSPAIELPVDRGKYFAFNCDDVVRHQSDINLMEDWSDDAGQQMKISIDGSVLAEVYADAGSQNSGPDAGRVSGNYNMGEVGAPAILSRSNILDYIADMGSVMDEQNVPNSDRWMVVPSWFKNMIKKSDLRDAGYAGDSTSMARNGLIGALDTFRVYVSNNMADVQDEAAGRMASNIIFGHKKSLTFASAMTKMDTLPNPKKFGTLVRGLNVYGFKVIDPLAMGHLYAAPARGSEATA